MSMTQGIFLLVLRLLRLVRPARWSRRGGQTTFSSPPASGEVMKTSECAHYLECVLPQQVQRSPLARALPAGFRFALDIRGAAGRQWSFCCGGEEILSIERGIRTIPEVIYHIDAETFLRLIRGQQSAQKAFLDGQIEIEGDMEKALMLAMFIEQFLSESSEQAVSALAHA